MTGSWRCPNCDRINEHEWNDCSNCTYIRSADTDTDRAGDSA